MSRCEIAYELELLLSVLVNMVQRPHILNNTQMLKFTSGMTERTGRMSWMESNWFKTSDSSSEYSIWFWLGLAFVSPYMTLTESTCN